MLCENRTVNEGMGDDGPRVAGPGEHTSRRARRLAAQDGAGGPSTPSSADAGDQRQRVVIRNPMKAIPKPITRFHPAMPGIGSAWLLR